MTSSDLKEHLASQIKGSVLIPGDEGYEESLKRWAGNSERKAAYVVLAESAEDISKSVPFHQFLARLIIHVDHLGWSK